KIVDKIIELNNLINAEIDKLVDLKAEAHQKIEKVCNEKFISLLTDIYINGYTFEQIAERMNITDKTVCRWHGQALQLFRKENNMT
ncbi:MAG: sigma-70 family RNA polymerase sigma factor, partial [Clostridia bacterium]|nr:sigma-70 family RNA polymerase sigma factor [Clostridia bacterium]